MAFDFDSLIIELTPEQREEQLKNVILLLKRQGKSSAEINTYLKGISEEEVQVAVQALQASYTLVANPNYIPPSLDPVISPEPIPE